MACSGTALPFFTFTFSGHIGNYHADVTVRYSLRFSSFRIFSVSRSVSFTSASAYLARQPFAFMSTYNIAIILTVDKVKCVAVNGLSYLKISNSWDYKHMNYNNFSYFALHIHCQVHASGSGLVGHSIAISVICSLALIILRKTAPYSMRLI
jgi:hypothetical protein